jgi:hypothetical protein
MDSNNVEIASPTLDGRNARLEDKDPVLRLLLEISTSLKDLNLTFKDHAARFAKLEEQKLSDNSGRRDEGVSEQDKDDDDPVETQSTHENPEEAGSSKNMIPEPRTQKLQVPQGEVDDIKEVKYGTFPPVEAYRILQNPLWDNQEYLSWLKEKRLGFAVDGRYPFPFDIVNLADSSDLNAAHQKIDQMEKFGRDLRKKGGFIFFRESDMQGGNKIWNGSDIFTLPDKFPLPFPSPRQTEDEMLEQFRLLEQRNLDILRRLGLVHYLRPNRLFSEPSTFYDFTEVPWKMKTPFRRLW